MGRGIFIIKKYLEDLIVTTVLGSIRFLLCLIRIRAHVCDFIYDWPKNVVNWLRLGIISTIPKSFPLHLSVRLWWRTADGQRLQSWINFVRDKQDFLNFNSISGIGRKMTERASTSSSCSQEWTDVHLVSLVWQWFFRNGSFFALKRTRRYVCLYKILVCWSCTTDAWIFLCHMQWLLWEIEVKTIRTFKMFFFIPLSSIQGYLVGQKSWLSPAILRRDQKYQTWISGWV